MILLLHNKHMRRRQPFAMSYFKVIVEYEQTLSMTNIWTKCMVRPVLQVNN